MKFLKELFVSLILIGGMVLFVSCKSDDKNDTKVPGISNDPVNNSTQVSSSNNSTKTVEYEKVVLPQSSKTGNTSSDGKIGKWIAYDINLNVVNPSSSVAIWKNTQTGHYWTLGPNINGKTKSDADRYCKDLVSGGFRTWTLPNRDIVTEIDKDILQYIGEKVDENDEIFGDFMDNTKLWVSSLDETNSRYQYVEFDDKGNISFSNAQPNTVKNVICVK